MASPFLSLPGVWRPASPRERGGNAVLGSREPKEGRERGRLARSRPARAIASNERRRKKKLLVSLSLSTTTTTAAAAAVFFLSFFYLSRTTTHLEVGLVLDLIEVVQRGAVVQLVKGDDLEGRDERFGRRRGVVAVVRHGLRGGRRRGSLGRSLARPVLSRFLSVKHRPPLAPPRTAGLVFFFAPCPSMDCLPPSERGKGERGEALGAWTRRGKGHRGSVVVALVLSRSSTFDLGGKTNNRFLSRATCLQRRLLFSRSRRYRKLPPQRPAKAQSKTRGPKPRKRPGWDAGFDANILKNFLSSLFSLFNSP